MNGMELEQYMSNGVNHIISGIIGASLKNPRASLYMIKHNADHKKAQSIRENAEKQGEHIPPFLIASITSQCNLHCKGCYARANHSCSDHPLTEGIMNQIEWGSVFDQAEDMGIEFILLAGGEPLLRKDVIESAGEHDRILFPIFTNGTMISDEYLKYIHSHANLIPIISIEGTQETTDLRRGSGTYRAIMDAMQALKKEGILQGASITVSKDNICEVLSDEFVDTLKQSGTSGVIYVEYVPVDESTRSIAPDDDSREYISKRISELRKIFPDMIFVSFPGDEKTSGGCLAAGRGFFHINAYGGAEPCPFSPYSDTSLKTVSLREALHSPLFKRLNAEGNLTKEHIGGCSLYEQRKQVEAYTKERV